jgi:hypothetical protein
METKNRKQQRNQTREWGKKTTQAEEINQTRWKGKTTCSSKEDLAISRNEKTKKEEEANWISLSS